MRAKKVKRLRREVGGFIADRPDLAHLGVRRIYRAVADRVNDRAMAQRRRDTTKAAARLEEGLDAANRRRRKRQAKELEMAGQTGEEAVVTSDEVERDFYAEGYDACMAGNSDTPPADVQALGPDAERSWNDGFNDCRNEQDDDGA